MATATPVKEIEITRAWRDELYYESLCEEEKVHVPINPAGEFDLDIDLKLLMKSVVLCYPNTCCAVHHTNTCTTQPFTTSCTTTC